MEEHPYAKLASIIGTCVAMTIKRTGNKQDDIDEQNRVLAALENMAVNLNEINELHASELTSCFRAGFKSVGVS